MAVSFSIIESDPQGRDAMALLREAAIDARALYPELHDPGAPWPVNLPTPPRGAYFVAYSGPLAVGMGAHRPLDDDVTEVRRMYVLRDARQGGVAKALLRRIEDHARTQGFTRLVLETGYRQTPAMKLYESCGFVRIAPFGIYRDDPTSVCYEKSILRAPPGVA
jgi:putative acetyltransferase